MLHNVAQMVKEAGMLELLEALAQNLLKCKNARRRVCVFLVEGGCQTRVEMS